MNELLEKDQIISIVPQDYKNSNKGKVMDVRDSFFTIDMRHEPIGFEPKRIMEFYSQTKHGTLYFNAAIVKVEGNVVVVTFPRKHRFLQRRTFTRIKFIQDVELEKDGKTYNVSSFDLSAGGIKIRSAEALTLGEEYNANMPLIKNYFIKSQYEPLKIEKNDDGLFTIAGRFKNLSRTDRMKIVQFCMRKDLENKNR